MDEECGCRVLPSVKGHMAENVRNFILKAVTVEKFIKSRNERESQQIKIMPKRILQPVTSTEPQKHVKECGATSQERLV